MMKAILKKAIYLPGLAFTLISINSLDEAKCEALFSGGMCTIRNRNGQTMAKIQKLNGLYQVLESKPIHDTYHVNVASTTMSLTQAHFRLGHMSPRAIHYMIQDKIITGINVNSQSTADFCEPCAKAKSN
jgi:GAG-pre-integrase domain